MTQLQLGEVLGIHQSEIAKTEHRDDICIRTLVDDVEALGEHLEFRAVFPDRQVRISQFEEVRGLRSGRVLPGDHRRTDVIR